MYINRLLQPIATKRVTGCLVLVFMAIAIISLAANVVRAQQPSSDATLSALALSQGTLAPTFDPATTTYNATVFNSVTDVTVTATANDSGATVEITPSDVPVNLNVGVNEIKVTVTAADGVTKETYSVTVTRATDNFGDYFETDSTSVDYGKPVPGKITDGDTLEFASGTYNTPIHLVGWDNVTLRGIEDTNGDRAIFKVPDERLLTATFDWRNHQYNIPGILVNESSNIVIDNFDLDFSQVTSELSIGTHRTIGVLLLNTMNATVSNNLMNDIGSEEQTTQAPLTIEARITPGYAAANGITHQTRADVDITGNTITNGGRVAIAVYGWMEASIRGNTVTTTDDPNFEWDTFGYAIQFTSGAQGTIEGNTFSGFIPTSLDRASSTSGALNLHSEYNTPGNLGQVVVNILVKDNTINDSNFGAVVGIVWCESRDGTELDQVVTFERNTFTDTPLGIGGASCLGNSPDDAASPGDNQDISLIVNNNVFRDIGDDAEDDIAMHLTNGGVDSGSSGSISLSAEGNTIEGFIQGLVVGLQEDPNEDNPDPNFGGSLLVSKLNVSHNYWDTAESPLAGPLEIEDGVSLPNGFSYEPWYADQSLTNLRTIRYINPLISTEALPVTTPLPSAALGLATRYRASMPTNLTSALPPARSLSRTASTILPSPIRSPSV